MMQMVAGLLSEQGSDGWLLEISVMQSVKGLLSVQGLVFWLLVGRLLKGWLLDIMSVMQMVAGLLSVQGFFWLLLLLVLPLFDEKPPEGILNPPLPLAGLMGCVGELRPPKFVLGLPNWDPKFELGLLNCDSKFGLPGLDPTNPFPGLNPNPGLLPGLLLLNLPRCCIKRYKDE